MRFRKTIGLPLLFIMAVCLALGHVNGAMAALTDGEQSGVNSVGAGVWGDWLQTTQADFGTGVLGDVDITASPNDVVLTGGDSSPEYVYALRGNYSYHFWKYTIASNNWSSRANTPDIVRGGGCLVYDGGNYVYALQGNYKTNFWRYSISENGWISRASTPSGVWYGGAMIYDGGNYIYALRGGFGSEFWRYSISANSWATMTSAPGGVWYGGALAYDGGNYIYGMPGNNTTSFWRYSISGNSWSWMHDTPGGVKDGGCLAYGDDGYLYAFRGGGYTSYWRYSISGNSWSWLASAPNGVDDGGGLTCGGGGVSYPDSGTIASRVYDTGAGGVGWTALAWSETLPSGTDITFEVRASDTSFAQDAVTPSWISLGTAGSPVTSGLPSGRYVQWRATLHANAANSETPVLHNVTVTYASP